MQQNENIPLKPIIEADPVAFTFDTVGWKVLFFLLICLIIYISYRYYIHYKNNQYRRDAIASISNISLNKNLSMATLITSILFQLKQTAVNTYGRKTVASLEGSNWLQFLDDKVNGINFKKDKTVILNAVYRSEFEESSNFNKDNFIRMSKKWIEKHA
jgi:uncharacterized protein DUF4381